MQNSNILNADLKKLQEGARRIRRLVIETIGHAGAGHTGGSCSVVEIMTVLYFHAMNVNPKKPDGRTGTAASFPRGTLLRPGTAPWRKKVSSPTKN